MLVHATAFQSAYAEILKRGRGSTSSTTFILVSPDPDAISAAHLLHDLLKKDYCFNTVIPIKSWNDLANLHERFAGEEVRSLILINLGSLLDLHYTFSYLPSTTLLHVIDSHRPINLANLFTPSPYTEALFDPKQQQQNRRRAAIEGPPQDELGVVVWMDEEEDEEMRETVKEAFLALLYEPDSDSDDSDSDSEDEDMEVARRRRRIRGSGSDEEDEDDNSSSKRRKSEEPQPLTKIQRRRYRARIDKYYSATYTGQSVANQIFLLAVLMERADEEMVWLAILGLTHQFTSSLIDLTRYTSYIALLSDEVARLSSHNPTTANTPNDRSIKPSQELRFCLFRHWNLFESMRHSAYVSSRMMLWKEKGVKNLSGMLAKMGYSLQQSTETYEHMDSDLKSLLYANMDSLAPEYGLDDLSYPSFTRKSGFRTEFSASDAVEGLSALLEVATGVRLDFGNSSIGGTVNGAAVIREEWKEGVKRWVEKGKEDGRDGDKENNRPGANGADEPEGEEEKKERKAQDSATKNFWLAWDALSTDTSLLRASLPLAMALHRSVTGQGTYILDKFAIQTFRTYRLAVIKEGPYLDIFRHPATLLRLANWLVDAVRDMVSQGRQLGVEPITAKKVKSLPFVLACLDQETDRFLVVGVNGALEFGDVRKNAFGMAFEQARIKSKAQTKQESFEASVIEVRKDDLPKFLKQLAIG